MTFGGEGFKVEPDLDTAPATRARSRRSRKRGDGKFVVAGLGRAPVTGFNAFEFGRYLPDGELDPGFGTNGLTVVPFDEFGDAFAMDQAPGGKIVAAGGRGTHAFAGIERRGRSPDRKRGTGSPRSARFPRTASA